MVHAKFLQSDGWERLWGEGCCESGWEEKVVTTSHLIVTKFLKEDVISILIIWIRKQRLKEHEVKNLYILSARHCNQNLQQGFV